MGPAPSPTPISGDIINGWSLLSLTAVAAHPRFVALGTNAGLVYWYDRAEDVLHRLWCADRKTAVTRLALVESVELMLAAGNREGSLTIFQIQR